MTAIAFSNAKPHRKDIYTNKPFFISIVAILLLDTAFVFMPNPGVSLATQNTGGENWLVNFFLLEPFYKDGVSYYSYRYFIAIGIIVNSAITLVFEKWLIVRLTKRCDDQKLVKKQDEFRVMMEGKSDPFWKLED